MADDQTKKFRRVNGFQAPYHYFQVLTWLLFPLIIVHYFAFIMQIMWDTYGIQVFVTVIFCFFSICTIVFVYYVCHIDPGDSAITGGKKNTSNSHVSAVNQSDSQVYCYICETHVHKSSKHCRYCDKCVDRFDHHCKWLNTCVGRKNYNYFLGIIASVGMMTLMSLSLSIALLVESFAYPNMFENRLRNSDYNTTVSAHAHSLDVCRGLLIGSVVIFLVLVGLLVQLGGFHAVLVQRGMTTYEFIVAEQKRQRELEALRVAARTKNTNSGNYRLAAAAAASEERSGGSKYAPQVKEEGDSKFGEAEGNVLNGRDEHRISLTSIQVEDSAGRKDEISQSPPDRQLNEMSSSRDTPSFTNDEVAMVVRSPSELV